MLCEALAGMASMPQYADDAHALIEAAFALINQGIGNYWNTATGSFTKGNCFDRINEIFGGSATAPYLANLYRGTNHDQSASQYINRGVRGRVDMAYVGEDVLSKDEDTGEYIYTLEEQCWKLDSLIAEENFFELSGEGHVMYTMYRLKRSNPGHDAFFIDWMAGDRPEAAAALASDKGWFIDYKLTESN